MDTLLLYRDLRDDPLIRAAAGIFDGMDASSYYDVQRALLDFASEVSTGGTCWEDYVCQLVAGSVNVFSRQADLGEPDARVFTLAVREMRVLKSLYGLDWLGVAERFQDVGSCVAAMPSFAWGHASGEVGVSAGTAAIHLALRMEDDTAAARALADYYRREGFGLFQRYRAFRWDGALVGVERPDAVRFDDLIGYDIQKKQVIDNGEAFVRGLAGLNMLLYGDRGTGKSSCVKALLNMFSDRKLRLVALAKERIGELSALMDALAGQGCRFLVFIDDLSFEENETGYKAFKSALEGNVTPQPENVMVCVTSNRRNIIKEVWRERDGQDDIHAGDAIQEKRSLADRFGLTVTFSAPDKNEYLGIVSGIAAQEGLDIDEGTLALEAMRWEIRGGGKSGRTARQFVNYVKRGY